MSAWSVKTRRAPSRHCRDARIYGHTTAAMHDNEYTPRRILQESGQASEWIPTAQLSALRLLRALAPTMTSKQLGSVLGEDDAHSLVRGRTICVYMLSRPV